MMFITGGENREGGNLPTPLPYSAPGESTIEDTAQV
jgi:hypothetical protein